MQLDERIRLMGQLGSYFREQSTEWQETVSNAHRQNAWFTPDFVNLAVSHITEQFLDEHKLRQWLTKYPGIVDHPETVKTVGVVMAGNIPLVGFHDFLCVFLSGHRMKVKLSSKDTVLWENIFATLKEWQPEFASCVSTAEMLKGCDAYIATGSDNSARYFSYYFEKYAHIIRKNRTSVALLTGKESSEDLQKLADDICQFYGLGCRNISQVYVPQDYDFKPLLRALEKYQEHIEHNKYKNNYDYQLALFLLNKQYYMTDGHLLLVENASPFAPLSVLHYQFYAPGSELEVLQQLSGSDKLQCLSTEGLSSAASDKVQGFGCNQNPSLSDYADGIDTMAFLQEL